MPPPEPVTTGNWCPAKPICAGAMPHPTHGEMGSGVLRETRVQAEVAPSAQRAHKISGVPSQVTGPGHHTALATIKRQARDSPFASSTKLSINLHHSSEEVEKKHHRGPPPEQSPSPNGKNSSEYLHGKGVQRKEASHEQSQSPSQRLEHARPGNPTRVPRSVRAAPSICRIGPPRGAETM